MSKFIRKEKLAVSSNELTTQRFFQPEPPCSNTFSTPLRATTALTLISSSSGTYKRNGNAGCVAGAGASQPLGASARSGEHNLQKGQINNEAKFRHSGGMKYVRRWGEKRTLRIWKGWEKMYLNLQNYKWNIDILLQRQLVFNIICERERERRRSTICGKCEWWVKLCGSEAKVSIQNIYVYVNVNVWISNHNDRLFF